MHRVYGLQTQANGGYDVYHMNNFYVLFATGDSGELRYYEENGERKHFVRDAADYRTVFNTSFANPFLAEQVAIEGIESNVYYNGLRLEIFGCDVGTGKSLFDCICPYFKSK